MNSGYNPLNIIERLVSELEKFKWISVKEKLPAIGETCLLHITYPEGTMFNCRADHLERTNIVIGGLLYNGQFTSIEDQFKYDELKYVSHWMPLPKPPEEK